MLLLSHGSVIPRAQQPSHQHKKSRTEEERAQEQREEERIYIVITFWCHETTWFNITTLDMLKPQKHTIISKNMASHPRKRKINDGLRQRINNAGIPPNTPWASRKTYDTVSPQ